MSEKCSFCSDGKDIIYGFYDEKLKTHQWMCSACGLKALEEEEKHGS